MRKIILAGLALLSLGAVEARAAAPDTSRVPVPDAPRHDAPAEFAAGDVAFLAAGARSGPADPQDSYDRQDYRDRGYGQYRPRVRVWLENDRDLLRPGDRSRVLLRTTEDAYVAVIHIDTNGDVEFLYPGSPYDDGWVRGGRTYVLPTRGASYLNVRGGYGIGYIFAIAADRPLEYHRFRDSWYRSARWDRGRNVYGDPFHAMERFERTLVRDWDYGYHDTDHYTYHVGRRYTYPRYACYDDYGPWYYSRATTWGSCDRVRVLLVSVPYYYDTRRYRGDRRVYYRRHYPEYYSADRRDPQHGYKDRGGAVSVPPLRRTGAGEQDARRDAGGGFRDGGGSQEPRVQQPERTRPTFGRRAEPQAEPPAERRAEPEERSGPRYIPRRGSEPEERRAAPPAERRAEPRSEPRREAPAERRAEPRSEPRREAPAERRAEPRSEPRREAAPPSRSSGEGSSRARPPDE